MDKNLRTKVLGILLVSVLTLTVFFYFYLRNNISLLENQQENKNELSNEYSPEKEVIQKGILPTPVTKVQIGTEGLTRGTYSKVEAGDIFLNTGENLLTRLPLTADEIAVSCTTQNLTTASELDFNQVIKVNIANPGNLSTFIPENETVVAFSQNIDGVNTVHTIALDSAKCTQ